MTPRHLVSADGGDEPAWSPDGKELYFRRGDGIMVVRVAGESAFQVSPPEELFHGPYPRDRWGDQSYDVAPDGRFLMMRADADNRVEANVVLNWIEEVRHTLNDRKR